MVSVSRAFALDGATPSEAGEIPALSRNGDAPPRGTSPDAWPASGDLSSEEGRFARCPPASQRAHFVLRDPGG